MSQYYKITNRAEIPFHMSWNKELLSDEDLEAYNAFKETDGYLGVDPQDKAMRKKVAEAIKARPFYDAIGKDVQMKRHDRQKQGDVVITVPALEWQFVIGQDPESFMALDNLSQGRRICEEYGIKFTTKDSMDELNKKLTAKYGPNVRIVTERQWKESGMKNLERKSLKVLVRDPRGKDDFVVQNEGILEAEELTDTEAYEYLQLGKGEAQEVSSYDDLTDDELKDVYATRFGRKPTGLQKRQHIIAKLSEADGE